MTDEKFLIWVNRPGCIADPQIGALLGLFGRYGCVDSSASLRKDKKAKWAKKAHWNRKASLVCFGGF
jgi:hypothetical protein